MFLGTTKGVISANGFQTEFEGLSTAFRSFLAKRLRPVPLRTFSYRDSMSGQAQETAQALSRIHSVLLFNSLSFGTRVLSGFV